MNEDQKNNKQKKPLKNWAIFSGIAIQMCATILLFAWGGQKLDEKYPSDNKWFTIAGVVLGVSISLYAVLKQLKRFNS
ncbi:AtpZ/AtpI family protein [Mesonia maritima]|uniref:Flagellar basal body-associated protein FliL n=1 Tax=Mesonia maritima TaxID=1793873 RepID=A0ABU1K2L3_9FLAO|nr:AtpZ/AtpI family protein [Mesonia maritima]MDR6299843.1 flagellar basal body-associated protein FliL [Mesonia maritima]